MRLPPIPPAAMKPTLRALHDDMAEAVEQHLKGFVSRRDDGALVGPFPPLLHFPQFGAAAWAYTRSLIENATLPRKVREVAILAVGARLSSRYELYAHEKVAEAAGLAPDVVAALAAGQRPPELDAAERIAHDVAAVLAGGRPLPASTFEAAVQAFGQDGVGELVHLVGCYCLVSVLLNAFDIPVPGNDDGSTTSGEEA